MFGKATLYAMANRVWGSAAGLVTIFLVGGFFSPELQGYYYTFASLLTLETLVELGFGSVVQQFASHEWARIDSEGSPDVRRRAEARLASLSRLALRWYRAVAVILFLALGIGGSLYFETFSAGSASPMRWQLVWWAACLATGASVLLTPLLSILEGINRVHEVYRLRLGQAVVSRWASWLAILAGGGLWAVPIARVATVLMGVWGLTREELGFFRKLWREWGEAQETAISWKQEVWPLQWKFAVSWLGGYFVFSLFTPVLFAFHGPSVAGQMGMTLSVAAGISSVAFAVVATKVPTFAMAAARRHYRTLDDVFWRATLISLLVVTLGAGGYWMALYAGRFFGIPLAFRFLPPLETGLLLLAVILQQLRFAFGSYLRAHKKEPFLILSVIEAGTAVVFLSLLGRHYGALGMTGGFLALVVLTLIPGFVIFKRCRAAWHSPNPLGGESLAAESVSCEHVASLQPAE